MKKNKKLMEVVVSSLLNNIPTQRDNTILTDELIQEMLQYSGIKKCVSALVRGILSRDLIVMNETDNKEDARLLEIQKRVNLIKNKTKLIEEITMACFQKRTLHEIIYNEDFTIKELIKIPNELIKYNRDKKQYVIKTQNKEIDISDKTKWLFTIHNQSLEHIGGVSLLDAVLQDYLNIKDIKNKLDYVASKYGETVIIFAYGVDQSEEEIKQSANDLKKANGGNVIGIPLSDGTLKDNIFTMRLSDIDTTMYERLIDRYERNITTTLLGGSLTIDNGGGSSSYSLGQIHQEEKEKIEDSIALFVRDELDKLIDIDGAFFGYDPTEYYIALERMEKEAERLAVERQKIELQNTKIQGLESLSRAGYELDEKEVAKLLGVAKVSKKEYTSSF